MIDYYLNKKCSLMFKGQKEDIRCKGCIWLDQTIKKCIFSVDYPFKITLRDFGKRMISVDDKQQNNLSNPNRRFII